MTNNESLNIIKNNQIENNQIEKTSLPKKDDQEKEAKPNKLPRKIRILIFSFFTLINIIVNMDSGNIPPAIKNVKSDFKINDSEVGTFPSLVSTGTFIGGLISLSIIDRFPKKLMLIVLNLGIAVCLYCFQMDFLAYIPVLFINRILVGMFMAYNQVYFPVWIDYFGPKRARGMMLALVQVGVPVGIVLGYLMTTLFMKFDMLVSLICLIYILYMSYIKVERQLQIPSLYTSRMHDNMHIHPKFISIPRQRKT